jgi:hypothetical protein
MGSGNPLVGKRIRLLRYQGPEQRSRKVPTLTAESNTGGYSLRVEANSTSSWRPPLDRATSW